MKTIVLAILGCLSWGSLKAQPDPLIEKINKKLAQVDSYEADALVKTNVAFIKAATGKVKVYYKKPDQITIKKKSGISLLPKNGISLTVYSILNVKQYTSIPSGWGVINGKRLQLIKLVPADEGTDWVISTLWVDPDELLVYKIATTTKENGSYEMLMQYGAHAQYGLAQKVTFTFNTKDYKLPNGITLEFGDDQLPPQNKSKANQGSVEIVYQNYVIQKAVSNSF